MDPAEIPRENLTELADFLIEMSRKNSESGLGELGGGIHHGGVTQAYTVSCYTSVCSKWFATKEEAAKRWLQLRLEGKI